MYSVGLGLGEKWAGVSVIQGKILTINPKTLQYLQVYIYSVSGV